MGLNYNLLACCCALFLCSALVAQTGDGTFKYQKSKSELARELATDIQFGGLSYSTVLIDEDTYFPLLIGLHYEYDKLLLPREQDKLNVALCGQAEVMVNSFFVFRVSAFADLLAMNSANVTVEKGFGFRGGLGFSAVGATSGFSESYPAARIALLFGAFRISYTGALLKSDPMVNHVLGCAVKLDL